jgi:ketosteroid isomerase-like protein
MPNGNVEIVRDCYRAFTSDDLEALLGAFAADIEWESVGRREDFPTLGPWRGIAEVRKFFHTVAETLEFHAFSPRELHGVGNIVFAMGSYEMAVRKTGRRVASDWLHVFWVRNGKVTRFREFTDTARFAEAWRS